MNWAKRSSEIEIMDDLSIAGDSLHNTLNEIDRINRMLGGFGSLINRIRQLSADGDAQEVVISDLGCGSGWLLKQIEDSSAIKTRWVGIDANKSVIDFARSGYNGNIDFKSIDVFEYLHSLDGDKHNIAISSLFCHHFTNTEILKMIEILKQKNAIFLINDLHRHPIALGLFKLLGYALNLGPMAKIDGAISIRKGFKREDWEGILSKFQPSSFEIKWKWAFRYQIEISN